MPLLMLKDLPRYECLLEAARQFPDLDPSATEAFLHLLRAGDEAFRTVAQNLAAHDITQGRFAVLMALWGQCRKEADGMLTPAELADHAGVTRATMSGLIDTLVRDELVTRAPHPEDRRMMCVQVTEKGMDLIRKIMPGHFRLMAWLLQPLHEEERKQLVTLLTKISARAAERPAASPGASAEP